MPLTLNALERFFFLTLNQGPMPALDMWSGPAFRTVLAGIRLDVFETLNEQPATVEQLAQHLNTDVRGTRILLETLDALGYVKQHGRHTVRYTNTNMTRKWLTDEGAINFSAYYQFWGVVLEELWPALEESIRTGRPPVNLYEWIEHQPDASRYFQEGMIAITRYVKDDVINALALPAMAQRVLDVGGGHALYSVALCEAYPQLSAVVFDSSQALTVGRETIAGSSVTDRVTTREGNFNTDDLGTGYDAVLLFNVVHGLSAKENVALLCKAATALNAGGRVYIAEQIDGASPLPIQGAMVQVLGMSYFHLLGGQLYGYEEMRDWLTNAGFTDVLRTNVIKAGSAIISGTVGV